MHDLCLGQSAALLVLQEVFNLQKITVSTAAQQRRPVLEGRD